MLDQDGHLEVASARGHPSADSFPEQEVADDPYAVLAAVAVVAVAVVAVAVAAEDTSLVAAAAAAAVVGRLAGQLAFARFLNTEEKKYEKELIKEGRIKEGQRSELDRSAFNFWYMPR